MTTPSATAIDVTKELARRLRLAVTDGWDTDRCELEATSFFAELRQRGWHDNPDADWRRTPRTASTPGETARAALTEARTAIRNAQTQTQESTP